MGIDIHSEHLISLSEAARLLPGKPSPATIWRWYSKGVKGVRLTTIVCGGRRVTSKEALQKFCDRLTEAKATQQEDLDRDMRAEATRRRVSRREAKGTGKDLGDSDERREATRRRLKETGLL